MLCGSARRGSSRLRAVTTALALLFVACGGGSADPPAPPVPGSRGDTVLRLVTWNVHDLFDERDRTTPPGDEDTVPTHAAVEAKLAAVGRVLARIDADVIVLQEVESVDLLERLAAGPLAGRGYLAFLREGNDPRGIDVGILSRLPFEAGPSHLDERGPDGRRIWSRDVAEIHVALNPRPLFVFGAHLVSRLDPADDPRRRLQAESLRGLGDAARHDTRSPHVVIVGDLNDIPSAPALAPLLADGAYQDLGRAVPASAAWTWSGAGLRERMDYALVPADDGLLVTGVQVDGAADVAAASDHRPLVVDAWLTEIRP